MIEAVLAEVRRKKPNHFDVEYSHIFREALCAVFCNRKGGCRGCPAGKLDHETYKVIKIGELINVVH